MSTLQLPALTCVSKKELVHLAEFVSSMIHFFINKSEPLMCHRTNQTDFNIIKKGALYRFLACLQSVYLTKPFLSILKDVCDTNKTGT